MNTQDAAATVRVCGAVPAAALGFSLVAGETYQGNIVKIVTEKCAACHAGDQDRQNSTTCGFLEKNLDSVITRMENSLAAQSLKAASDALANGDPGKRNNDQIRDQISANDRTKWPMPPVGRNPGISQSEIDTLKAWKSVPNKCIDASTPDEPLAIPSVHTDDDEQRGKLAKMFETDACEDGPSVARDKPVIESILTLPSDSLSGFYDYEAMTYVDGARKMEENCSIDYFIAAVAMIPGAQEALKAYKDYGWWVTQCAIVDGRPQAYLSHIARVKTALGDTNYGVFLKLLKITDP